MKRLRYTRALVISLMLGCFSLTACATKPPVVPRVTLAVAGTCIPKSLGPPPSGLETRETLATAPDDAELFKRIYADWKVRVARSLEVEPVISACR